MRKVKITNATGKVNDTRIFDVETGELLTDDLPIDMVQINMVANDSVHVRLGLALIPFEIEGRASFGIIDPRSGTRRVVKSITLGDGEVLELGDGSDGPKPEGPFAAQDEG